MTNLKMYRPHVADPAPTRLVLDIQDRLMSSGCPDEVVERIVGEIQTWEFSRHFDPSHDLPDFGGPSW